MTNVHMRKARFRALVALRPIMCKIKVCQMRCVIWRGHKNTLIAQLESHFFFSSWFVLLFFFVHCTRWTFLLQTRECAELMFMLFSKQIVTTLRSEHSGRAAPKLLECSGVHFYFFGAWSAGAIPKNSYTPFSAFWLHIFAKIKSSTIKFTNFLSMVVCYCTVY